jgi:ankyrin repeat protein
MLASQMGSAAIVQALIGAGADLNLQNKDGETALMQASEKGHTAIVQALIEAGADLNLQVKVSDDAQRVKQMCPVRPNCLARS